jgi:cytoskeletal protein RodZ
MGTLGEQLSAARREHGFTTAQVAARLRIRTMFVEALESERWAVIGEFVYVRGFLKNYARLLGLDPAPFIQKLAYEFPPESPESKASAETLAETSFGGGRAQSDARNSRWFPWVLGSLTAIAAALVVMVGISLVGLFSPRTQSANATQPGSADNTAGQSQLSAASNVLEANSDGQNQGGVKLRLQLTQRSWLSVTVDGKRVVYETLPAGTVREFHGVREISLRAGNAGGVVANIDGKDLGRLGQAGQVEDRVFAVKTPADLTGAHE